MISVMMYVGAAQAGAAGKTWRGAFLCWEGQWKSFNEVSKSLMCSSLLEDVSNELAGTTL